MPKKEKKIITKIYPSKHVTVELYEPEPIKSSIKSIDNAIQENIKYAKNAALPNDDVNKKNNSYFFPHYIKEHPFYPLNSSKMDVVFDNTIEIPTRRRIDINPKTPVLELGGSTHIKCKRNRKSKKNHKSKRNRKSKKSHKNKRKTLRKK